MPQTDEPGEVKFITAPQIATRYSVSHKWLSRKLQSDPSFPRPVYFGDTKKPFFKLAEIEAYERACILRSRGEAV